MIKDLYKQVKGSKGLHYSVYDLIGTFIVIVLEAYGMVWISQAIDHYQHPFWYMTLVIAGRIGQVIIEYARVIFRKTGVTRIYTHMHTQFSWKILDADYRFYSIYSPGEVTSIKQSIDQIAHYLIQMIGLGKSGIMLAVNSAMMVQIAGWKITLIIVGVMTIIVPVFRCMMLRLKKMYHAVEEKQTVRNREFDDFVNGFAEVRTYHGGRKYHKDRINNMNLDIRNMIGRKQLLSSGLDAVLSCGYSALVIGITMYVILMLQSGVNILPSLAITLIVYVDKIVGPIQGIIEAYDELSDIRARIPRFLKIMEYQNAVEDGDLDLMSFESDIELDDVRFSYDSTSTVLDGISLTIKKGEHIGICGTSGGGKSTLLKLIPRFYDVTGGSIKIDGVDLRDLNRDSIMKHIGIVHQDPFMFDGTIRDNIRYAVKGREVSDVELIDSCKKAAIYEFIMDQPNGFDTYVGPRGLKLSGGQKQRIALARLFLADPEIILLDEATSALDNDTEKAIQEALDAFSGKTIIAVAHRLSTIINSDKIVVIDKHRIAEMGTHDELVDRNGIYAAMVLSMKK